MTTYCDRLERPVNILLKKRGQSLEQHILVLPEAFLPPLPPESNVESAPNLPPGLPAPLEPGPPGVPPLWTLLSKS